MLPARPPLTHLMPPRCKGGPASMALFHQRTFYFLQSLRSRDIYLPLLLAVGKCSNCLGSSRSVAIRNNKQIVAYAEPRQGCLMIVGQLVLASTVRQVQKRVEEKT